MITARTLTRAQAEKIKDRIDPTTEYICKLCARMNKVGCPDGDSFRIALERAHDAMRSLSMELHYISCKSGVGRPSKE
jgi:hypothetical protein